MSTTPRDGNEEQFRAEINRIYRMFRPSDFNELSAGTLSNLRNGRTRPQLRTLESFIEAARRALSKRPRTDIDPQDLDINAWRAWYTALFVTPVQAPPPAHSDTQHIKDIEAFHAQLVAATAAAKLHIYRSGTGSLRPPGRYFDDLERAEREALDRGVEIVRIQTSPVVDPAWAKMLKQLKVENGERYRVLLASTSWPLDACIIDPGGDAVVVLLFETDAWDGTRFVTAEIVRGNAEFANSLAKHFAPGEHLEELDADGIERLGQSELVVAYGDHMNKNYNRRTTPGAQPAGIVTLHGWTRTFYAPPELHDPRSCAMGVMRSTRSRGETVVVLRIPEHQRVLLDAEERGRGYRADVADITLDGAPTRARIYVPAHIPDDATAEQRHHLLHGGDGWVSPNRQILNDTVEGMHQILTDGWRRLNQHDKAGFGELQKRLFAINGETG
ncbi:hypothetical protein ACFPIJ_22230 [Dactylosporangium cerinum]|uniref:XRE family transcriptional regulator n=1 Tax=Dactylosporangium cerinum TaxID=1434730 RepID=A0ABV9W0R9_9ACTN